MSQASKTPPIRLSGLLEMIRSAMSSYGDLEVYLWDGDQPRPLEADELRVSSIMHSPTYFIIGFEEPPTSEKL